MRLGDLFADVVVDMMPGEDFAYPVVTTVARLEYEDDPDIGPYESPRAEPVLGEDWPRNLGEGFAGEQRESVLAGQGWASMCVALRQLTNILEVEMNGFPPYRFQTNWEGGRL